MAKLLSLAITLLVLISLPPNAIALTDAIAPQLAQTPSNGSSFVTAAVNRVGNSVVRIDTERVVTRNLSPFPNDPFFERFFGDDFFPTPAPREQLQRGQGSGFIVDATGTILTNAHVVNRADRVTVRLKDGRDLEGRVAGVDTVTDLAVIKVNTNGRDLPVAPLGDSETVQVGIGRSPSATPWDSITPSPWALSAPSTALAPKLAFPINASTSSKPTPPSIPVTPAARSSTLAAKSSELTPPFGPTPTESALPFPSIPSKPSAIAWPEGKASPIPSSASK